MGGIYAGGEDRVTLTIGPDEILLAERYQVKMSILTQPSSFGFLLGDNDAAVNIYRKFLPNSIFKLFVNGIQFSTGRTDSISVSGAAAAVNITGRDLLSLLHDDDVEGEESYTDITYAALVRKQLDLCGLSDAPLVFSNKANRYGITGGSPVEHLPPRDVTLEKLESENGGLTKRQTQAHLGESRYSFIRRHLDHVGLFLWADATGGFVLSEPNGNQAPLCQLIRNYDAPYGCNILDDSYVNDTTGRHSEYLVYARGSKKGVRATATGKVTDQEMTNLGFVKKRVFKDANCDTPKKAEFMARRAMAEARRAGRKLSYTVDGHTSIAIGGGKAAKVLYAPDTVIWVQDDKYGLEEAMYVEGVTYNGDQKTTTLLDLIRLEDLVFSDKAVSTGTPTSGKKAIGAKVAVDSLGDSNRMALWDRFRNMADWVFDMGTVQGSSTDDDGAAQAQADNYGAGGTGYESHHPFGFVARPLDPDATGACLALQAHEGDRGHIWPLGDARITAKLPALSKGGSCQYSCDGTFASMDPKTSTYTLYVPTDFGGDGKPTKAHVLTIGKDKNGARNFNFLHTAGPRITISDAPGELNGIYLANKDNTAWVCVNDTGVEVNGNFKVNGNMGVGPVLTAWFAAVVAAAALPAPAKVFPPPPISLTA